jgi:hypothetical protein
VELTKHALRHRVREPAAAHLIQLSPDSSSNHKPGIGDPRAYRILKADYSAAAGQLEYTQRNLVLRELAAGRSLMLSVDLRVSLLAEERSVAEQDRA